MKLMIERDEVAGLLGGTRFQLRAKCELTRYERGLVEKYKAHREILAKKEIPIPLTDRVFVLNLTIGNLIDGQVFKCADIAEILAHEEELKSTCNAFRNYLQILAAFGGQETFDFGEVVHPALEIRKTLTITFLESKQGVDKQIEIRRQRAGSEEVHTLLVPIPASIGTGDILRIEGQGNESRSGHGYGDVVIEVAVLPEPERPIEVNERQCPACGKLIKENATTCMHCWAKLGKK